MTQLKKIKRLSIYLLVITSIVIVIAICATRLLTPMLNQRLPDFEKLASQTFNAPVKIAQVHLQWYGLEPQLFFENVKILNKASESSILEVKKIKVNLSVFRSLFTRSWVLEKVIIDGVILQITQKEHGQFNLGDLYSFSVKDALGTSSSQSNETLGFIFSQKYLMLENVTVDFISKDNVIQTVELNSLKIKNSRTKHIIKGEGILKQTIPTTIQLEVTLKGKVENFPNVFAKIHCNVNHLSLIQWLKQRPFYNLQVKDGLASGTLFATWNNRVWESISSQFTLNNLVLSSNSQASPYTQLNTSIKNVKGELDWNGEKGKLSLLTENPTLTYPALFEKTISFNQASGEISIHKSDDRTWTLTAEKLQIKNKDIEANSDFMLNLAERNPKIDLEGNFKVHHAENFAQYLPTSFFTANLRTWLKQAFKKGTIEEGKVILQGNLNAFPFDHQNGKFLISGKVNNLDFQYATDWPMIKNMNGNLIFSGRNMTANAKTAFIQATPLKDVRASIANIGTADPLILKVQSEISSDLANLMQFINTSPLKTILGTQFSQMNISGPTNLKLKLTIPLSEPSQTRIEGNLVTPNARVEILPGKITLDSLKGTLDFTEKSLTVPNLQGRLLNEPIQISGLTEHPSANEHIVKIKMLGQINLASLNQLFTSSFLDMAEGKTHYEGELSFPMGGNANKQLIIHSNLKGIKLDLPQPYNKTKAESKDIKIALTAADNLKMEINYQQLKVTLSKLEDVWQIGITNPTMTGQIKWPEKGTVQAEFANLTIPDTFTGGKKDWDLKNLPPISFVGNDVRYGNKKIGRTTLILLPSNSGITIKDFSIVSPVVNFHSEGEWQIQKNSNTTHLQGLLSTDHATALLKEWGFSVNNLEARKAKTNFDLTWNDVPYKPNLGNMSGNVSFKFDEGEIINLSKADTAKIGLGRMLNILNLESIPKRLSLNFKDLFEKGYGFDYIKGDFALKNGNASTDNLEVKGSIAKVEIKGRIGLQAKDYDLKMDLTPYVTSSLPVVATIAGGPIAGAATWVVDKMVSSEVSKVTTYKYRITGPWSNPTWSKQ